MDSSVLCAAPHLLFRDLQVAVTGNKANQKTYFRHTQGRPGGWKVETFNELQKARASALPLIGISFEYCYFMC
jgi:hypothetical protein